MVDGKKAANAKLTDRGGRIIQSLTRLEREASGKLLREAGGKVKTALVMHARGVERAEAESLLAAAEGQVGQVIEAK